MTFKLPDGPSPRAPEHELADFAELTAWGVGSASIVAISRVLGRLAENDHSQGVLEDDEAEPAVDDAFVELERRREACGDGYPFEIVGSGDTLRAIQAVENPAHIVYVYLLLATRLRMDRDREHAGVDGALLFERLSAEVACGYLGARAESLVFGTGGADFPSKIDNLCRRIGEGGGFVKRDGVSHRRHDGKLDVVAWKPFSDEYSGKIVVFGQCKTGTRYKDSLTQLQPDAFFSKWCRMSPVVNPVRAFFVSESLPHADREGAGRDAGLIFDRCRIVDFCDGIEAATRHDVATWTKAAAAAAGLPGNRP